MTLVQKVIVAVSFTLAWTAAGTSLKLSWSDCGGASNHVKVNSLTPGELVLGQTTTITGQGVADEAISGGKYTLTLTALGVKLVDHTGDLCQPDSVPLPLGTGSIAWHGESCPATKGANTLGMDVKLGSLIPPQLYSTTITLTATATNGDALFCVAIKTSKELDMEDPAEFRNLADAVNVASMGWEADAAASGRFTSLSHAQMLLGTYVRGHPLWQNTTLPEYEVFATSVVPESFDPRKQWPKCTIIGKVRNQAGCGSCWAFGSTESFEGSRCIATGEDIEFSADDTAACSDAGNGCSGGMPSLANQWFVSAGVVTGGGYASQQGCLPYVCPPCKKGLYPPDCPTDVCSPLLKCHHACSNSAYPKTYPEDKTKAHSAFMVPTVPKMMQALSTTGPLAVAFTVYADFVTYKRGVYTHLHGGVLGGHAVVMLGWGTENGKPYWLIKNSWTAKWGDKGFFKIAKGVDECGIEDDVSGTLHSSLPNLLVV